MGSLQKFAAGRVDEDAVLLGGGAARRQAALPGHAPVPAEARGAPVDRTEQLLAVESLPVEDWTRKSSGAGDHLLALCLQLPAERRCHFITPSTGDWKQDKTHHHFLQRCKFLS